MQLYMVADDLTGALDSVVMLAEVGLTCGVARRPSDIPAALARELDVIAVSTASREGSVGAACEALGRVFDAISEGRPAMVFKKIDSRLKGHIAAELSVVAARMGIGRALVTPAIPGQGRIVEGGRLVGTGVDTPIEIAGRLAGSGLDVEVPDIRSDGDLDRVLARALAGPPVLLVGAAGLAAALARRLARTDAGRSKVVLRAPLMFAIGSRDPITLAQVDALRASGLVDELMVPDGILDGPPRAPAARPLLVRLVPGTAEIDPRTAGGCFAGAVGGLLANAEAGTLLACGGETADSILGELGVGVLEVDGQILPGVPVSSMVVEGRPMHLITKSGGFGDAGTLVSVVVRVQRTNKNGR